MNLFLLFDEDFRPDGSVTLTGRRALHAHEHLAVSPGDKVRVGHYGGLRGTGEVLTVARGEVRLRVQLTEPPPPRPGVDLILAMPRPKALKKVLSQVASLGVDRLVLVNAARVEKAYFSSRVLQPAVSRRLICEGLEQAQDTRPPQIFVFERLRPFVEDEMEGLVGSWARRLLAHPHATSPLQDLVIRRPSPRVTFAVGPEGGWVPFEIALLERHGFEAFSLGPRILRVETVIPYLLGQRAVLTV